MHVALPSFVTNPNPEIYLGANYLVLDFETTNHEKGSALNERNQLLLARWRLGGGHPLYGREGRDHGAWADEFGQAALIEHIRHADFLVAHHAKFEFGWLRRCGLDLRKVFAYDTMIGEKVLAGNRKRDLSLEGTATRRGLGRKDPTASLLIKAGVCPSNIPAGMLEDYCAQDVALTEKVFLQQRQELSGLNLLPVAYCRNLVTPCLADTEFAGMCLDPTRVDEIYIDYAMRWDEHLAKFTELTNGLNPKSSKQMGEFLYDTLKFEELADYRGKTIRTPANGRKTDKLTLAKLKAGTPEQKEFLKVARELVKLKTPLQNLTKMHKICAANKEAPMVYATYNQTVVATDRLSSTGRKGGFQFHNFDRAFKKVFRARRRGWLLGEGDAPQLEFRVAADLGHDVVAKADISAGLDVHGVTARILGTEDRTTAKPFTFKPLYGGNKGTPRQRKYFAYFKNRYAGIFNTQTGWTMRVAQDKELVTPWGLRFYWPGASISGDGYVKHTTEIFNYPIQSLATADIIPLVLILVWHRLAGMEDRVLLVNTVHDSIIAELSPEAREEYRQILIDCFTDDIYELLELLYAYEFTTPLGVGMKFAEHWADTKEEEKVETQKHFDQSA